MRDCCPVEIRFCQVEVPITNEGCEPRQPEALWVPYLFTMSLRLVFISAILASPLRADDELASISDEERGYAGGVAEAHREIASDSPTIYSGGLLIPNAPATIYVGDLEVPIKCVSGCAMSAEDRARIRSHNERIHSHYKSAP